HRDQGEGQYHRGNARENRHRAAGQRAVDVLLRGHGDHDGDVDGAPELHALFGFRLEQAAVLQVTADEDEQHHGDADATDVGRYADQLAEQLADEDAGEGTQGQ